MPKKEVNYILNIGAIPSSQVNHGNGSKKVFIRNEDSQTDLTQFAYSKFENGNACEVHLHPTMDEYFFVLSGCGEYTINNIKHNITKGDFIFIPAGVKHFLKTKNKNGLELVYFGVKK